MNKLQELRKERGYSQQALSKMLGVSRSTVAMWESGASQPSNDFLIEIANIFDVSTDFLLGRDQELLPENGQAVRPEGEGWIPVMGEVRGGTPIDAIEFIEDWEQLDPSAIGSDVYVGLRVVGDSMEPRISAGDVAIVNTSVQVNNNDIAVILVNGDTATIKKVSFQDGGIMLIPFNTAYTPKFYSKRDIETLPVRIFGRVVEVRAKF